MRKLLLILPLVVGCATPSSLPHTSANPFGGAPGTLLPVPSARLGPGRKPAFGPYRVTDTRRGWATTRQPPLNRRRPKPTGLLSSPVLDVPAQPAGRRLQTEDYQLQFHFRHQQAPPQQATVYCAIHRSTQLVVSQAPLLGQLDPELRRRTTETFQARLVGPLLGGVNVWDLVVVTTPRSGVERDNPTPVIGLVGQGDQVLLRIRLVTPPAPVGKRAQRLAPLRGPRGAEILHQGQRIAYLDYETVAADLSLAIWLRDDLAPDALSDGDHDRGAARPSQRAPALNTPPMAAGRVLAPSGGPTRGKKRVIVPWLNPARHQ